MQQLSGKTALVTGASSGIGLAITNSLLQQQCRVFGIARDFSKSELHDPLFTAYSQDLGELQQTSQLAKQLCQEHPIDFFIHSAGSGLFGSVEQFSVRDIGAYISSNLTSALVLCHHLVPSMRKHQAGRIIIIGSESALNAGKKGVLYSSAKFGLRGMALSLREDCSKDGINVSLINPGMVRTPFFDTQSFAPGPEASNAIEAQDIADTVLHILYSNPDIVFDEINLSPRNKSLQFHPR
jgi:short-subunit dehydrogenase